MEESNSKAEESVSFINHMLNFDEDTKNELTNISQYSLLAIVPVIALNKFMKHYIPVVDEDKGTLEITFEIVLQMLVLFFGLFFVHRFVVFFKPYSGREYPDFSIVSIIMAVLLITLSIQSKLGEKSNIVVERLHDLWTGETSVKEKAVPKKKKEVAKQISETAPTPNYHVPQNRPVETPKQEVPNYNMMYHNTAAIPSNEETHLLAANEVLGGGGMGSMY